MNILMLSNKAPYPPNDGSSIAIYNMARGFLDNGHKVHLLSINTKKHFKPDSEVPQEFKLKSHYQTVYRDANTSALGALSNLLFSRQSYFVSRFYFEAFRQKLISTLQNEKFDWVQLEGIFMADYISDIRQHSNAKIALRTHNAEHIIWDRVIANEKSSLKKWYLQLQNKRLKQFELSHLPMADAIVPITENDASIFKKCGIKTPSKVCPTGILAEDRKKSAMPISRYSVFHLGSMDWIPNEEGVLWFIQKVWPLLVEKTKGKAKCYLAGRNMPESIYNAAGNGIEVIGEIKHAEELYKAHAIQIVPLLSGSGMRIKILDGLRFGKAIVSTRVGAEGIPLKDGENILIADAPEDFAEKIVRLMENESYYQSLCNAAFHLAETQMDNTQQVKELIEFYQSL